MWVFSSTSDTLSPRLTGLTYDNVNRRSTLTLTNGIVANYSYDQNSNLTGIGYSLNGSLVGDLSYGYDAVGRRVAVGGSMAATGFPTAISSAVYDAANELTSWNGMSLAYDQNGPRQQNLWADSGSGSRPRV